LEGFKKLDEALLAGKALLMYQKFIKPGSFLNLDLPKEIITEIEQIVLDQVKFFSSGMFS
jgi:hypothetical protein